MAQCSDLDPLHDLAQQALSLWHLPADARISLLNVAENLTYLVIASHDFKAVLRLHRHGYHGPQAIRSELMWLDALKNAEVLAVPGPIPGRDGQVLQWMQTAQVREGRYFVLFEFVDGTAPDETQDLVGGFEELGAITARCHSHVLDWDKPESFTRHHWDAETVFGNQPTWGDWRAAPGVTPDVKEILENVEQTVRRRLARFGKTPDRYNLIHADMRLANLLVSPSGTRVIDFDDCGYGWLMYDFAAAISFIEDDPRVPKLKEAWLRGYRSMRSLPPVQELEIDTMIMLRRMALLAWIGSHMEAPEPQALAPGFARTTAQLGDIYLNGIDT